MDRLRSRERAYWRSWAAASSRLLLTVTVIAGCRTVPIEMAAPEVARLQAPVARLKELDTGRVLYTSRQKCARCHRPHPVTSHTASEWSEKILPRMARKAKLSELEQQYVLTYILTARTLGNQPSPER